MLKKPWRAFSTSGMACTTYRKINPLPSDARSQISIVAFSKGKSADQKALLARFAGNVIQVTSTEENKMKNLVANAHWLLRVALASVFVYHGILKFLDLEGFTQMLPISYLQVVLVAAAETVGGSLVLLGGFRNDFLSDLATRVGAAMNVPVMVGAIWMVHWGRWNFLPSESHPVGGIEFQTVLILVMLYLAIIGNRGLAAVGFDSRETFQSQTTMPVASS